MKDSPARSMSPVLAAAWGTCLGWSVASLVTALARAGILPIPIALGDPHDSKPFEKLFFLSFYVIGPIFAFVAARFSKTFKNASATGLSVLLFLAFARWLAAAAVAGPNAYWLALPIFALGSVFFIPRNFDPAATVFGHRSIARPAYRLSAREVVWLVACSAFFAACLFPLDLETVAAGIGYDVHVVSFYIGPALYLWHRGLLPGIDFFPQYGLGIGAFFSLFLRRTAEATIANTILVTAGLSLFYFASALLVIRSVYRSRLAAFAVVLFGLLLTFHTLYETESFWVDPSSWPARYPFLFLFVWLFALAVESKRQTALLAAAGAAAGLSFFWNTETGGYAIASALIATLLLRRDVKRMTANLIAVAGGATVSFFLLSAAAYGPGVFQLEFITALMLPMRVYAGGYGALPILWQSPFNLLYAVIGPFIGLATMGWTAAMLLRREAPEQKRTLIVLFLLATLGTCLQLKWVNRSFDAQWQVNALPLIAVMGWWVQNGLEHIRRSLPEKYTRVGIPAVNAGLLIVMLLFLCLVRDDRNPTKYALQAFAIYPSVMFGLLTRAPHHPWPASGEASATDIALVQRYSHPGDPVTVLSPVDWVYLLAAERPPRMPWLPIPTVAPFPFLVTNEMFGNDPIFVDRRYAVQSYGEPLSSTVESHLDYDHKSGPASSTLQVYFESAPLRVTSRKQALVNVDLYGAADAPPARSDSLTLHPNQAFVVGGWAYDTVAAAPGRSVLIVVDGKHAFPAKYGVSRPDVAAYLKNASAVKTGFESTVPVNALGPGAHTFTILVIGRDGTAYSAGPNATLPLSVLPS